MNLRTTSLLTIAGGIVAAAIVAVLSAQSSDRRGIWAAAGQRLDAVQGDGARDFPSPNRLVTIREREGALSVIGKDRTTLLEEIPSTPSLTEVLWSPNSAAFVINASDGGLVGTWDAHLYVISADGRPTARDVRRLIEPQAKGVAKCATEEVVNFGAATWLQEGKELLIVLEVPPHTSCRNPGALVGYRLSLSEWKVLERIPEQTLRTAWSRSLGRRFAR